MKIKTKPTDLVLEVGSGDNPREQTDILLDRFIISNNQRAGKFSMRIDRPIIVGDGYYLPFADKQFDYVICSHVLEHLDDPVSFANELIRVGKKGYVEIPNIFGERLFGWDFHLWYCEIKNNELVMTRKKEGEQFGGFFHRLIAKQIWFRHFFEENEDKFYLRFVWKHHFKIRIKKVPYSSSLLEKTDQKIWELLKDIDWSFSRNCKFYVKWMSRRIIRKIKKMCKKFLWDLQMLGNPDMNIHKLISIIRCIQCRSSLTYNNKKLVCTNCQTVYFIDHGIPILLTEKDKEKGY